MKIDGFCVFSLQDKRNGPAFVGMDAVKVQLIWPKMQLLWADILHYISGIMMAYCKMQKFATLDIHVSLVLSHIGRTLFFFLPTVLFQLLMVHIG